MPMLATFGAGSARAFGFGAFSVPAEAGQSAYTSGGTYTWIAPAGVTTVSVVAVGAGQAGSYGSTLTAEASYFIDTGTVAGYGGSTTAGPAAGGTYVGDGGGNGGATIDGAVAGGGAGGYAGNGGAVLATPLEAKLAQAALAAQVALALKLLMVLEEAEVV